MKKILGFGYKTKSESLSDAIDAYCGKLCQSEKQLLREIKLDRKLDFVSKQSKLQIFRLIVEVVDLKEKNLSRLC